MVQGLLELVHEELGGPDSHDIVCYVCQDGGDLICCDGCSSVGHLLCVGLQDVPQVEPHLC